MFKIRKKDWIEVLLHIVFWAGVFYTVLSFTEPHIKMRIDRNGSILEEDIRHTVSPHIFLTIAFMIVLFYSDSFWLLKRALRYKNVLIRVILPVAWFGIIFLADSYVDALLPPQKRPDTMLMPPLSKNGHAVADQEIDRVESHAAHPDIRVNIRKPDSIRLGSGDRIRPDNIEREVARQQTKAFIFAADGFSNTLLFIFIIIFGLSIAYFFLKEWSRVEKMRSELAAVQLDTEVKFLKSQVNPHFLFNTLNNLFSMAQKKGNDDVADGISKLSGMMRYMIYESNAELVPLKDEIAYLEDSILLSKLRYADDEAIVRFDHPADIRDVFVAPMLFIPFVENAFKHGIAIGRSSEIDISIAITNKKLVFSCANEIYNVNKMEDEKGGIGLENVKRRLELVYPGKHALSIKTDNDKYIVDLAITLE